MAKEQEGTTNRSKTSVSLHIVETLISWLSNVQDATTGKSRQFIDIAFT